MRFKSEYLFALTNLFKRKQNWDDQTIPAKEKDEEEFFYWLLRQAETVMQGSRNWYGHLHIIEKKLEYPANRMCLIEEECGEAEAYISHLDRDEFIQVMRDVAYILVKIGDITSDIALDAQVSKNPWGEVQMQVYINVKPEEE